jgi:hypothetical protein
MALSETSLCNMSLGRIGANRINSFDDTSDEIEEAIQCRLHYVQTRDALQRSHAWVFNGTRVILSQDTTGPVFEFDNQFIVPSDYLRARTVYDESAGPNTLSVYSAAIEANADGELRWLTNQAAVNLRYSQRITDPGKFDPLFAEVLILKLARKLVMPLSGAQPKLLDGIDRELIPLERKTRALDRNERNRSRRNSFNLWEDARFNYTMSLSNRVSNV